MNQALPEMLRKYFWDCDFRDLTDKEFLKEVVEKSRNLDKKTRNYWKIMLYDNKVETMGEPSCE